MSRTVYALLVGIDAYQSPVAPLSGCVNDIREIEAFLRERVEGNGTSLDARVLTDEQATRPAIIEGFRNHLTKAGPDDVAFFYYSGHGSQQRTAPELLHLEPDGLDETVVCHDSRSEGGWDLADKELATLIRAVEEGGGHVSIVLDCCHSGSGTRAAVDHRVGVRHVPLDDRVRPFETYELAGDLGEVEAVTRGSSRDTTGWSIAAGKRHVLLSGCRADELSKELPIEGRQRGVFSYALLTTLQGAGSSLTYRDVHKRVEATVRRMVGEQTPQIESVDSEVLRQPFLGGDAISARRAFTLRLDRQDGWVIDGGAVHGIAQPVGEESTVLALFDLADSEPDLHDPAASVGEAVVTAVHAHVSNVDLSFRDGSEPDPQHIYRAIVTATPLPRLGVLIQGDERGTELVRTRLTSTIVAEASQETAELRLQAREDGYRISRMGDSRALVVDITGGYTERNARQAIQRLEHVARWIRTAGLTNPTSQLPADAVTVSIYRQNPGQDTGEVPDIVATESEIRLEYAYAGREWQPPSIWIRLANTTGRRLYCALLDLTARYAITSALVRGEWLGPGEEVWALAREPVVARIPDDLWRDEKVIEYHDLLKLIVSTEAFDASLLEQGPLDAAPPAPRATLRGGGMQSTLARLMARVHTRDLGAQSDGTEAFADWVTSEIGITTVRPLESRSISNAEPVDLGGLTVLEHPALVADARLTSLPVASRSLDTLVLPRLLRDDPDLVQPLELSASRGGEAGLSVLELLDVKNPEAVTPEEPLRLRVGMHLAKDEHVLPVGFDGEFFLPLGHARSTDTGMEIEIQRLPRQEAADEVRPNVRDLGGSIRIFFHKVAGKMLGVDYPYPLLSSTDLSESGEVDYTHDAERIRERVEQASRILLLVHGIIGDTRGMASSAHRINAGGDAFPSPLARHYDLILAFDYENLNTPIEQTAGELKKRLEAVGLGAWHGKELDIVAHSMGGLVSRWMIEREGGAPIVDHLVMLGTPNGGSPWPSVQKWATVALGLGLNAMTAVVWPVKVLGWMVQAVERIDEALDQMEPGSAFLTSLAQSGDPGVPYTVLAGNTSIIEGVEAESRLGRLLDRLDPVRKAANMAFFGAPNDLAASVKSITALPAGRDPDVVSREVACDHSTYLDTEVSVAVLIEALP
jgi:pimeloyl-ACP methyl ester carboxylesterase